ncbi:MAG: hypothetical protein HOP15_11165 [Planctomycetes bacterium]|nr:hypothetical protein [Planctomycetota bacterium]
MPASIKLQQQYGDALQVLFVESQGADADKFEAFAWRQKWMGTQAMWTDERPLEISGSGLPAFALLDIEGKILLQGNPLEQKKKIEEAIAEQVKKASSAPAGTPAVLAKSWARFTKGDVAAALAECDKLGTDVILAEPAKALRAEMVARTEAKITRGQWLIESGYAAEASTLFASLAKSVAGTPELEGKVGRELARLKAPDKALAAQAEASKALASLQQKMVKDKPFDDGNVKALLKLAEKHAGTKAGERAARLAKLAKLEP